MLHHIPNLITLTRILLVLPVVYGIYQHQYPMAMFLFAVAGLSDGVDGYLARQFKWTSRFGALMDPAADKFLLGASSIALVLVDEFPFYLLLLLVVRDLMIICGAGIFFVLTGPFQIAPSRWGKFSTFLHISLLLLIMIYLSLPAYSLPEFRIWLDYLINTGFWVVAVTGLISGFTYLWYGTLNLVEDPGWRIDSKQESP
ncbi:MAG: CDP-alcohol phosphatidyltransferase family protein [Gammaproteobacteria bacterium]|nr:CDP-alcohol phosphatidyltransferase family protein [Gammaproteobacteria bacterium]